MINFDKALGVHPQMLTFRAQRAGVLAANLANADTPNYKARDLDFSAVLDATKGRSMLQRTRSAHFEQGSHGLKGELLYRTPMQASLDQNTVEVDLERAKFMENAMRYQASMRFLDGKFSGLRAALRGE
ncbi:MAG: flagellar basal body rod protein FlgB [Pseudomonadota bacterium]